MISSTVFEAAAKKLDEQIKEPLRQQLLGRKLFAKTYTLPPGKFSVEKWTWTDMGSASISYSFPSGDGNRDSGYVGSGDVKVPVLYKEYMIERMEFMNMLSEGYDMNQLNMMSAAYEIGLREDDMLFQGWAPDGSSYQVEGLYQDAGNTYASGGDWGTFGNPTNTIAGGLAACWADNVMGCNFNLTLNYVQYAELLASRSTNGVPELPDILNLLNLVPGAPAGQIFVSADIIAGTALMTAVDPVGKYFDLVIASDMANTLGEDSKRPGISPIYGTVWEAIRPRVHHDVALCTLTSI